MRITSKLKFHQVILLSALFGIFAGIFFGELCGGLRWVGKIYIMLIEAAVFPYIISSLLHSLGKLSQEASKKLFKCWLWIYFLLIIVVLAAVFILSLAIPLDITYGTDISITSMQSGRSSILNLLVPSNIFDAIALGYIPAVVLFIILFGLATQAVRQKKTFLDVLSTVSQVSLGFWKILLKFAPIAVFSLLASIFGTIQSSQFLSLGAYIILFYFGTFLLGIWIIPGIISSLTSIPYRHLMHELRDALIVSTSTTISVLAIPYIQRFTEKLLKEENIDSELSEEISESTTMISYPFGQIGNCFILLFVLFAAFYYQHEIHRINLIWLPFITIPSSIGTPNTTIFAVHFLANFLHLPTQSEDLYSSILTITQYPQIFVSVTGVTLLTVVTSLAVFKKLKIRVWKLTSHLLISFLLISSLTYGMHLLLPNLTLRSYQQLKTFKINPMLKQGIDVTIIPFSRLSSIKARPLKSDSLFSIASRKTLRVGYNPNAMPFSFYNDKHELVGYDIAYAFALARSLHVKKIIFVPFAWNNVAQDLKANKFDIAMAGAYVTPERLENAAVTQPYLESTAALIVPKKIKSQFENVKAIQKIQDLVIASDIPLADYAQTTFPNALIEIRASTILIGEALLKKEALVGISSKIQAKLWVALHPEYTIAEPDGMNKPVLLAYLLNKRSPLFLNYVNYFLNLQKANKFQTKVHDRWILVKPIMQEKRWSIIHNVLGL